MWRALVMAAVNVVLPWSTWPMVPTFRCGFVRELMSYSSAGAAYSRRLWSKLASAADLRSASKPQPRCGTAECEQNHCESSRPHLCRQGPHAGALQHRLESVESNADSARLCRKPVIRLPAPPHTVSFRPGGVY